MPGMSTVLETEGSTLQTEQGSAVWISKKDIVWNIKQHLLTSPNHSPLPARLLIGYSSMVAVLSRTNKMVNVVLKDDGEKSPGVMQILLYYCLFLGPHSNLDTK